mmetsp:Transcript_22905/g.27555  ORF Transcript_22905/g.27555 Transcript_22905/m.27555 type:complete len:473 (-) Transcript_22905:314-1732(-)
MMNERVLLNPERMGDNLQVTENQSLVTQTGNTQNFDGAWILGTHALTRGRWVCEFQIERRKRWMAVGYALDTIKLNRPINRTNIFVYASTGSIKANDHARDIRRDNDSGDGIQAETNSAWSTFGAQYKTNDIIRAYLDMDLGVLGFSLTRRSSNEQRESSLNTNDEPTGADDEEPTGNEEPSEIIQFQQPLEPEEEEEIKDAYGRLRGLRLFPAIYVCGQRDTVRFKCSRLMDPIENPSFLPLLDSIAGDELGADSVTFLVDGKRIKAHKFLLTARSQYFKTMINNHQRQFGTSNQISSNDDHSINPNKSGNEIVITGADYKTFLCVLRFIYSGGDPEQIPPERIVDVFKLASEYTLRPLAIRCLDIMENSVTPDNALSLFSLCEAHLPLTAQLKHRCVEVIRDNVQSIASSSSFDDLCTHPSLVKALVVPLCLSPPNKRQRTADSNNNTYSALSAAELATIHGNADNNIIT